MAGLSGAVIFTSSNTMAEFWGAIGAGAAVLSAGVGAASAAGAFDRPNSQGGAANYPTYQGQFTPIPGVSYNPSAGADAFKSILPSLTASANKITANDTRQREKILPGSAAAFRQGGINLNSLLQGNIPQDALNRINQIVAERSGGGNNPFTGGGQAVGDFARNIGQTSLDLMSRGLSLTPSWLSLANSFITSPLQVAPLAAQMSQQQYAYDALNTNIDQFNSTGGLQQAANMYQAGQNTWGAFAQQDQQLSTNLANLSGLVANAGRGLTAMGTAYNGMSGNPVGNAQIATGTVPRPAAYNTGGNWYDASSGYRGSGGTLLGNPYKTGA